MKSVPDSAGETRFVLTFGGINDDDTRLVEATQQNRPVPGQTLR